MARKRSPPSSSSSSSDGDVSNDSSSSSLSSSSTPPAKTTRTAKGKKRKEEPAPKKKQKNEPAPKKKKKTQQEEFSPKKDKKRKKEPAPKKGKKIQEEPARKKTKKKKRQERSASSATSASSTRSASSAGKPSSDSPPSKKHRRTRSRSRARRGSKDCKSTGEGFGGSFPDTSTFGTSANSWPVYGVQHPAPGFPGGLPRGAFHYMGPKGGGRYPNGTDSGFWGGKRKERAAVSWHGSRDARNPDLEAERMTGSGLARPYSEHDDRKEPGVGNIYSRRGPSPQGDGVWKHDLFDSTASAECQPLPPRRGRRR